MRSFQNINKLLSPNFSMRRHHTHSLQNKKPLQLSKCVPACTNHQDTPPFKHSGPWFLHVQCGSNNYGPYTTTYIKDREGSSLSSYHPPNTTPLPSTPTPTPALQQLNRKGVFSLLHFTRTQSKETQSLKAVNIHTLYVLDYLLTCTQQLLLGSSIHTLTSTTH